MNTVQSMLLNINPLSVIDKAQFERYDRLLGKAFGYSPVAYVSDSQDIASTLEHCGITDQESVEYYEYLYALQYDGEIVAVWGSASISRYGSLDVIYGDMLKPDKAKVDVGTANTDELADEYEVGHGTMTDEELIIKVEIDYDNDRHITEDFELSNCGSKTHIVMDINHDDCPYDYLITTHRWEDVNDLVNDYGYSPSEAAKAVYGYAESDLERVIEWYNNDWEYVYLTLTLVYVDEQGNEYPLGSDSVTTESDNEAQHNVDDLLHELLAEVQGHVYTKRICPV